MDDVQIHPQALVETTSVGAGTRVWAFAHLLKGCQVGRDCNVGDHVFIEGGVRVGDRCTIKNHNALYDGVTLEDDVFVGPAMHFTNDLYPRSPRSPDAAYRYGDGRSWFRPTLVRQGATLGAGCTILPGLTVGAYAMVGAGAVVTRDVPAHAIVVGNPARAVGHACRCGLMLRDADGGLACDGCGKRYRSAGERVEEVPV